MGKFTFEATDANFPTEVLKSETPVLVDFWADWCQPCRMIAPIVDKVAEKYTGKLRVGKLDVDSNPNVTMSFGVSGIPTLILFKDGKVAHTIVGYRTQDKLEAELKKFVEPVNA